MAKTEHPTCHETSSLWNSPPAKDKIQKEHKGKMISRCAIPGSARFSE
jgi:hypothetical protein